MSRPVEGAKGDRAACSENKKHLMYMTKEFPFSVLRKQASRACQRLARSLFEDPEDVWMHMQATDGRPADDWRADQPALTQEFESRFLALREKEKALLEFGGQ